MDHYWNRPAGSPSIRAPSLVWGWERAWLRGLHRLLERAATCACFTPNRSWACGTPSDKCCRTGSAFLVAYTLLDLVVCFPPFLLKGNILIIIIKTSRSFLLIIKRKKYGQRWNIVVPTSLPHRWLPRLERSLLLHQPLRLDQHRHWSRYGPLYRWSCLVSINQKEI